MDRAVGGREGALVAALARTEAAGDADRRRSAFLGQMEPIGIDEIRGMGDFAAQDDGISARRALVAARRLHQALRHRNITHAIGRFAELDIDAIGDGDGFMHVPQGAGAAEAGELQARGAVPLGDVPGHVDAAEEEGDAAQPRPLQRREAVAGLLEADAESAGEPVYVVTFRENTAGQRYEAEEFAKLRAAGAEPRIIVFARADREGLAQSTAAERATAFQPGNTPAG